MRGSIHRRVHGPYIGMLAIHTSELRCMDHPPMYGYIYMLPIKYLHKNCAFCDSLTIQLYAKNCWIGMLRHAYGGAVFFIFLQEFILPGLTDCCVLQARRRRACIKAVSQAGQNKFLQKNKKYYCLPILVAYILLSTTSVFGSFSYASHNLKIVFCCIRLSFCGIMLFDVVSFLWLVVGGFCPV